MNKYITAVLLLFLSLSTLAQQDLYIGAEILGGTLGPAELESGLLDKKNYSPTLGVQLNASFRFSDLLAVEAGIGQHRNRTKLRDENFEKELDGFSLDINSTNLFWNYYAAVSTYYKIGKTDTYVYGKFGVSKNFYKERSITKTETVEASSQNINRSVIFTNKYSGSNISLIPEIGLQHKFFKGNLLNLGIRYNMGQSRVVEGTYTITDNNSQQSKSDRLKSVGNAFAISLRFDIKLHHFPKREKVKKKKQKLEDIAIDVSKKDEPKVDDSKVEVKSDSLKDKPQLDSLPPTSIANRNLVVKDRVRVHDSKVKIIIWDHQTVDGDRVSLNLNGKWILQDYELKKEPLKMELELHEGTNLFVLHALNLGKYEPNTAALIVYDGDKRHRIILESNLNESGSLEINYKKGRNDSK